MLYYSRCQLLLEPLYERYHPTLVHLKTKTERVRVIETRRPRRHDPPIRLVRLEPNKLERARARYSRERRELIANGGREARKADHARVGGGVEISDETEDDDKSVGKDEDKACSYSAVEPVRLLPV